MVKIINKCILSILVYKLILDRHYNIYIHRNMYIHRYIGCLHEIEIQFFKQYDLGEKRLDTKLCTINSVLIMIFTYDSSIILAHGNTNSLVICTPVMGLNKTTNTIPLPVTKYSGRITTSLSKVNTFFSVICIWSKKRHLLPIIVS